MSTTPVTPTTPATPTPSVGGAPSWAWTGFLFMIVLVLIFSISFKSCEKDDTKKIESNSQGNNIYEYIDVTYSGEYSTVYVASGLRIAFIGATQPYCVKNMDEVEACGEKGQDVSSSLPPGSANTTLYFHSTSGKTGNLRIRTRAK